MTKKIASCAPAICMYMLALVVGMVLLAPMPLKGQSFYGSIVGTVTDSSGAIVPGATVTVTNMATNEKRSAQSSASGDFNFVNLVPSSYAVEVQKSSFKRFLREQVTVQVGSTVRVDAAMQVGETTETVEVTTQAPLLQTDSGSMGSVIEGKTVEEMPLNGRNTMNLLSLAAGVVPTANSGGGAALGSGGHTTTSNWSGYSIGGGLTGYSAMFIDGSPLNVLGAQAGGIGFIPTQDAVQEFNVVTNSSTSEFGRYSGGVVNMTTKSGGNVFHGSAYEYVRNQMLNANEWFNKRTQVLAGKANKPNQWNQNQYGVTVTGPIKKDKLFFLGSWESFSNRQTSLQTRAVPTQDMLDGIIYTASSTAATTMINYINGLAGNSNGLTSKAGCASLVAGTTKVKIASNCWDTSAKVMMTEWPTYTNTTAANNFEKPSGTGADKKDFIGRADYNLSANQRLFARFVSSNLDDMTQEWMPGGVYNSNTWHIGGGTTVNHALNGVIGDTITINPTSILDVRFSVMRVYNDQHTPTTGMDLSVFGGGWGTLQKSMTTTNIPMVNVSETSSTCSPTTGKTLCAPSAFANSGQISYQWNDNVSLVFSLTKIVGAHSLKIGGETRFMDRYMQSLGGSMSASGNFTFSNSYYTNSGWANFLLGMPNAATQNNVRMVGSYNWYQGYYVNDTWQASRKLTVTAGVRWELPGNVKEKKDNAMVLVPGATDKDTGYYGTGVLVNKANSSGYSYLERGSTPAQYGLFAPNIGVAYRLTDKDVIRGGYGFNYAPIDIQTGMFPEGATMNSFANTWDSSGLYASTYPLSNPFPNGLTQPVTRANFSGSIFAKQNIVAPVPTSQMPYTQQWNLSLSHQFAGDMMIEIGYAGSKAKNLPMTMVLNELDPSKWTDQTLPVATTAACGPWEAGKTTVGQCNRPHPAYLNYNDAIGPYGWTNYHAMPVKIQKRFRSGGMLNASFTWSKAMGNTGGGAGAAQSPGGVVQNWYNLDAEKSITAFSLPKRLVISYIYNLPIGKGGKFLSNIDNPVLSRVISGWAVNGIATYQSGFPVTIAATAASGTENIPVKYGSGTLRPNYTPGCTKMAGGPWREHVMAGTPVINTSCWTTPATTYTIGTKGYSTTMGNAPRIDPVVKAPGYNNWDISIQKRTAVTEKFNLDFRAEFFNAFNHERFGMPTSTLNANNFGLIVSGGAGQSQPRLGQLSLRLNF